MTAYVSHSRWRPTTAFCKSLDPQTSDLAVRATLLPSVNTTRPKRKPLVGVQTSGDHLQKAFLDGIEYFVGVLGGPNAKICACWFLGVHHGGVKGEAEEGVMSGKTEIYVPSAPTCPFPVPEPVILICLLSVHEILPSPLEGTLFRSANRDTAQET